MVELASFRFPQKFSSKGRWPLYIEIETRLICKDYKLYTCMNSAVKFHWYASSQLFLVKFDFICRWKTEASLEKFYISIRIISHKNCYSD